jgi:hypothetical protein
MLLAQGENASGETKVTLKGIRRVSECVRNSELKQGGK